MKESAARYSSYLLLQESFQLTAVEFDLIRTVDRRANQRRQEVVPTTKVDEARGELVYQARIAQHPRDQCRTIANHHLVLEIDLPLLPEAQDRALVEDVRELKRAAEQRHRLHHTEGRASWAAAGDPRGAQPEVSGGRKQRQIRRQQAA